MEVSDAINRRRSSKAFEPDALLLSRESLEDLIAEACQAPSEYNLQPWRFLVVRDRERKQALYDCCFKQEKIRQAAALIVICGDMRGWERAEAAAQELIESGYCTDAASVPGLAPGIPNAQFDARVLAERIKSTYLRDECARVAMAYRNPALVAMNLILLATERGIATCPIAGFSEVQMRRAFEIPERFVPVMIVALGMPSLDVGRLPAKPRRPLYEVVFHEDMASW